MNEAISRYVRDGRAPIPENETVSRIMSLIKGKNTGPELAVRKALTARGLSGYRLQWKKAPGRPDVCYPGRKIAIFIHGCYWHRCPHCKPSAPRTHQDFWNEKFRKNKARDKIKLRELRQSGWKVLILWECQVRDNLDACLRKINSLL